VRAKEYLSQIEMLDKLIENRQADAQRWRDIANNTTVNMSGERVQSSGSHDVIANAICTYLDIEREEIDGLLAKRKVIISVIEQLPPIHYDLLHKVYVQHFTLKEVASIYDMSYNWATTTHGKALNEVQNILNKGAENGKRKAD
jgi:DNA-directed RNA polymerase specialized sigma subunit